MLFMPPPFQMFASGSLVVFRMCHYCSVLIMRPNLIEYCGRMTMGMNNGIEYILLVPIPYVLPCGTPCGCAKVSQPPKLALD